MDQLDQLRDDTPRRSFLAMAGAAATSVTLLDSMLGAAPALAAPAARRAPRAGNGQTVLILGAGIAGLTAALDLVAAGYQVKILEAQERAGGRNFTARRDTEYTEKWADGSEHTQTCKFDRGLYLNMGPGRLPYIHRRVLRRCHELGVRLEPYLMETTANLYQSDTAFGRLPMPNRRIANDTRGWLAELGAEAVLNGAEATKGLSDDEKAALLRLLEEFGQLKLDYGYFGSTRSGLAKELTVTQMEEPIEPLPLDQLLAADFWAHQFYHPLDWNWEPTSFQPVGGMDMIVRKMVAALPAGTISYLSPVHGIRRFDGGVEVAWSDKDGKAYSARADYCLSNMPFPLLKGVQLDGFSGLYREALKHTEYAASCKVGWQANERFWEGDDYQIYGGISWINHEITQVWYPSNDFFTGTGTLTGAYNSYANAIALGNRSLADRRRIAREGGARLHREFDDRAIIPEELGLSIAWHKMPYQQGGWAHWDPDRAGDNEAYETLVYPDGNFQIIGDQVSPLPGWQEGAMMSAEWAVSLIEGPEARTVRKPVRRAPDSHRLTTGLRG